MKTITLRFVTEAGWQSSVIRGWTGGRFSHVGAITPPTLFGGRYELGARSSVDRAFRGRPGVELRPDDYARFTDLDLVPILCSQAEWDAFWDAAKRQLGCPYSRRTIAGFVFGRELKDKGHWDCSTLMSWCLVEAKLFPEALRDNLQQISPNDLWRLCQVLVAERLDWPREPLLRPAA